MGPEEEVLNEQLQATGIPPGRLHLFLRAFKAERELELWTKRIDEHNWQLVTTFPFCKSSGSLGPKRREGDRQIPEGVYHIDRFNPKSKFHLSLGLNYPNRSDQLLGDPEMPGSDIFIHGGCETVGCIPITDQGIEVVYQMASGARANGQVNIPVHIYPFRFTIENWHRYEPDFSDHLQLWKELEMIDQVFETSRKLPEVEISDDGHYQLMIKSS